MPNPSRTAREPMRWTPERIRRFWDYESQFPENYYSFKYGEEIVDRAVRALGIEVGRETTWLDYGCGYGSLTDILLARGFGVVIHDLSPDSLAACARRCAGAPGFHGTLAESDAAIDVVALLEVIEHVERDGMRRVIEELRSACRRGTRLVLTTPNNEDLAAPPTTVYCPACDTTRHRWQHLRAFTAELLERELHELGLGGVRVFEENFRRDKRFKTANPLRFAKRFLCDHRLWASRDRPNLLAVAEL